jgi:hypothetical protein
MDRAEAYRTLSLDESADGQMVQTAYWTLVRRAQERGAHDTTARAQIERCNEAYATLAPGARMFMPVSPHGPETAVPAGTEFIDRAVDWLSEEALRTRARWPGRNAEIGVIVVATLLLMIIALSEGASFWLTMLCALAVLAAVWAPWRRDRAPKADDAGHRSARGPAHDLGE